jgi:hypothetical protein
MILMLYVILTLFKQINFLFEVVNTEKFQCGVYTHTLNTCSLEFNFHVQYIKWLLFV